MRRLQRMRMDSNNVSSLFHTHPLPVSHHLIILFFFLFLIFILLSNSRKRKHWVTIPQRVQKSQRRQTNDAAMRGWKQVLQATANRPLDHRFTAARLPPTAPSTTARPPHRPLDHRPTAPSTTAPPPPPRPTPHRSLDHHPTVTPFQPLRHEYGVSKQDVLTD